MSDMETVKAHYPGAECYRMTGDNYMIGRPTKWEEPLGAGDYSQRSCKSPDEAWASARALLETKSKSPEGSTK